VLSTEVNCRNCRHLKLEPRPRGPVCSKRRTCSQELYCSRFQIWLRARKTTGPRLDLMLALCCKACKLKLGFESESEGQVNGT
jgi:hypothetical protein